MTPTHCRCADEFLLKTIDESPTRDEQIAFDAHLVECPSCVSRMRAYVVTQQMLRGYGAYEANETSAPLSDRLVQRILAARKASGQQQSKTG